MAKILKTLWVPTAVLVFAFGIQTSAQTAPVWTIDLTSSGYQKAESVRDKSLTLKSSAEGVAFTDEHTVLAYFVTKDTTKFSNRDKTASDGPFCLRAVFGDVSQKNIQATKDWPTQLPSAWLMPTAEGKIVVRSANSLQLYSSDLSLAKERPLSTSGRPFEGWHVKGAPSGRTVWLDHDDGDSRIEVLDADSLQALSSWEQESLGSWFSVSDRAIAKRPAHDVKQVIIKDIGGSWHLLYDDPGGCVSQPSFVNNDVLVAGLCATVGLISTTGKALMKDKIRRGEHLEEEVAASRNGKMVAVSLMRTKGGAFDTAIRRSKTTVVIYDLEQHSATLRVEVSPLPKTTYHFALAPDGSLLAVMTDSIVNIYATTTPSGQTK